MNAKTLCQLLSNCMIRVRQRQVVLSNVVEQYFRHSYAVDNSPVFPGAGDIFVIQNFYVKLGPANTRLVDWEQERGPTASQLDAARPGACFCMLLAGRARSRCGL
jgi:hypothetical protein